MNGWTLGLQTVNFLILVWLLQHFLYRPVREIMEQRKGEIDQAYKKVAAAQACADSARQQFEAMRAGAVKAAAKMLEDAREASAREREQIIRQAREEAAAAAAAAQQRIAHERERAETELRDRVARLGVEVAGTVLRQSIPADGATPLLAERALEMLEQMPREDRQRIAADLRDSRLEIATAAPLPADRAESYRKRIAAALEREFPVEFTRDPELIAGVELRLPHAVVNCTWKQSLAQALNLLLKSDGNAARHA